MDLFEFYKGKKVLITGHTGFKGTWLTRILVNAGAKVIGFSKDMSEFFEKVKILFKHFLRSEIERY